MSFLDVQAYGGPSTWRQLCGQAPPNVDGQGMLAPPWGDAIRAAKQYEMQNPNWNEQFPEGPAGQVIGFLGECGHNGFDAAADATEQAAAEGNFVMQGGGMPMGQPIGAGSFEPAFGGGGMPPHLACLSQHAKVEIKEKANWIEAITAIIGQEIEMANKYNIFADGGEHELFYAVEETDCFMRQAKQCAPDCAPWKLNILYTENGNNMLAYRMERPWTCTCCCFNRPVVDIIDAASSQKIGSLQDPFACCDLTFKIRDGQDNDVIKANGGCCQWGLCCPLPCGPCSEVNFDLKDVSSDKDVGHIQKKVPGCCKFFVAPDVDNYKVDFGGVTNPQWKAMLIGLSIFMDFRYFNDNSNDDNGGIMGQVMDD